jgi:hypothetical protein
MIMPENLSSNETSQREAASHERILIFPIMYRQKEKERCRLPRGRQANSNIVRGRRRRTKRKETAGKRGRNGRRKKTTKEIPESDLEKVIKKFVR